MLAPSFNTLSSAKSTFYSSKINYKQAGAMADEYEVFIGANVRGYHAHFKDATVVICEVLMCERELDNAYDKYAVAVNNEQGKVVGHVPKELSKVFAQFIRNGGKVEAECIGTRYNRGEGKGLEFPGDYKLSGNKKYLEKLVSSIKNKETTCNLNISGFRECQDRNS